MAERVAKLLGRSLFTLANFATINNDVVLAGSAVNPDSAEGKVVEPHNTSLGERSGALSRREDGEGRPVLFHVFAATVRADDLALLVIREGHRRIRSGAWAGSRAIREF